MTTIIKLTKDNVRTLPAKTGDTLYADHEVPGLYLRVRAGGSRTFVIQWRQADVQRRSTVGKVGVLVLDEARKKARKLLVGIDEGQDPIKEKAKRRSHDKQAFLATVEEYLADRSRDDNNDRLEPKTLIECRRHLLTYFKTFHKLPVRSPDRAAIAAELRAIANEHGQASANRARGTLSAFYGWCIGLDICEANPVIGTRKLEEAGSRDRVLSDAELVAIWKAAPTSDYGRIVKLLMLTLQRRDEIAGMRREERSPELLALPKERTKNGRAHQVPLSAQARAVLDDQPVRTDSEFVFGQGKGGFSGYSRSKERLDAVCGVTGWTLHDLRRTGATRMADLGIQPHVVEAVLNHVSGHKAGVAGIYNRSAYAAEKRAALDMWGSYIITLIAREDGANVTQIIRRSV
jgi:integrase